MKKPSSEQMNAARRLLEHEAQGAKGAQERAAAAGRVHEKLFTRLASLLGVGGARALLARSVRLTSVDFPPLGSVDFDAKPAVSPAEQLVTLLRAEAPDAATEMAVALCAHLIALLTTLIGERLTFQLLRSAWSGFDVNVRSKEETR